MPSTVRGGLECRTNTIEPGSVVKFHKHRFGHWLTCAAEVIDLQTEQRGRIRMLPGDVEWVEAEDMHQLSAPAGRAKYSCIGLEGL